MKTLVASVAVGLLVSGCQAPQEVFYAPGSHGYFIERPVGATFTDGFDQLLLNEGPITVTNIESLGGGPGMTQVGVELVPPNRSFYPPENEDGFPLSTTKYPGPRYSLPLTIEGTPAERHGGNGWGMLIGLKVNQSGIWHRKAIRVTFLKNGRTYQQLIRAEIILCTKDLNLGYTCAGKQSTGPSSTS